MVLTQPEIARVEVDIVFPFAVVVSVVFVPSSKVVVRAKSEIAGGRVGEK